MRADAFRWFTRGVALALGAALGIGAVALLVAGIRVVVLVFLALLLASGLDPLIDRIRNHLSLRRGAALLLVYAIFFILVAGLALLVVPGAVNQFNNLGDSIRQLLDDIRAWAAGIEPRPLAIGLTG